MVQAFVDYYRLEFPILLDADGAVLDEYSQRAAFAGTVYPQQWLVGPDGNLLYVNNAYEPDELDAAIRRALADPS